MSAPLTFGSLFAGIGGFDLGFERAGMECRWQVEIDDYARRVLAKHWPNVRRHDDVRTWPQPDTERVDVICGGPPCQPASIAGLRKGDLDERWMWGETIRIIRDMEPAIAVLENPTGILRLGREFGLFGIACWKALPDNPQQNRKSVWTARPTVRILPTVESEVRVTCKRRKP